MKMRDNYKKEKILLILIIAKCYKNFGILWVRISFGYNCDVYDEKINYV